MHKFSTPYHSAFFWFSCLFLGFSGHLFSQETAESEAPKIWFEGEPYSFTSTFNNPNALMNVYFPMVQSSEGPRKRIMRASFPDMGSCIGYVEYLGNGLKQKEPDALFSIMPDSNENVAVCGMVSALGNGSAHMIEIWKYVKANPEWTAVVGTQFAVMAQGDEGRQSLEKMFNEKLADWGSEILKLEAPPPRLPFKEEPVGDASALGGFVTVEGFKSGRQIKVDASFAEQLGAPEPPKAPFQVLVPVGQGNLQMNGAPNVPEIAVFAITTDDYNIIEAVRYTSLTHDAVPDVSNILLPLSWIVEKGLRSGMLSTYGGQVLDRYRTKVGDLDAAVLLAESNNPNPEGPNFFFKFVVLPKPNSENGLAAAIMIDKDKSPDVKTVEDTMTKGFATKLLHTTEFLEEEVANVEEEKESN